MGSPSSVAVAVLVPLEFVDAVEGAERQRVLIDAVVRDHPALDHLTTAEIAEVPRSGVRRSGRIVTGVIDGDITSHGGKRFDSVDVDTERVQISGEAGQAAQPFVEDRCDDGRASSELLRSSPTARALGRRSTAELRESGRPARRDGPTSGRR